MAAVTQSVDNFLGGVSKQTDIKKLPGQVRDCLNVYPDPTYGLMKRPGFKFIENIYTSTGLADSLQYGKWFFIKRDNNETYIGVILDKDVSGFASAPIKIWNKDGTACSITFDSNTQDYLNTTKDYYDVLTVQDTSIITNKTKLIKPTAVELDGRDAFTEPHATKHVSNSKGTVLLKNISYSCRYMLKVKIDNDNDGVIEEQLGTPYITSIKYVGKSTNLVDLDRKEGNYLSMVAGNATTANQYTTTYVNDANGNARTSVEEAATFNVLVNSSGGTTISVENRGKGYLVGDKFTFSDKNFGGTTPLKSVNIEAGETDAGRTSGTYEVTVTGADDGINAKLSIYVNVDGKATVSVVEGGSGWSVNETISIATSSIGGGSASLDLKVSAIKEAEDLVTEILELNDDVTGEIASQYWTINAEDLGPKSLLTNTADEKYLTATRILDNLKAGLEATALPTNYSWDVTKLDSSLEIRIKNGDSKYITFELTALDNQGNESIEAITETVNTVADLPAQSTEGRKVKVINTGSVDGTYWTIFKAEDGVNGKGYWEETISPVVSSGLDATTMPHKLTNTDTNTFTFKQIPWDARKTGDDETNKHPSIVLESETTAGTYLRTIQQTFFHNNRLGFLTDDNVCMSQTNSFYDFYFTSALTVVDSDPIDINCSSIKPAVLHSIIPTAQGLLLFSKNQQFLMYSDEDVLTPASTVIRSISNYEMDTNISPVNIGTEINFVSKTPSFTRIFSMQTLSPHENPIVVDIGKIVSEWVPDTVSSFVSSPQNSLIGLYGIDSPTLYIYKTYAIGDKLIMQAWVKWDLPGNIQHASIDSDTLYAVVEYDGKYVLCSASLTQTPEEKIIITSDGQQVNPHMDLYGAVSSMTYDSTNNLTKCYLPTDMRDNADLTPVLVIAGNGTENFAGVTESGFTIGPDRPSGQTHATSTPYFTVPNKDISGLTASNVIVGYKYNYDVELPKTYFKLDAEGKQYDYTAALTVARMKFALGLSSVCSFKVKSKGYRGEIWEGTGDGSTTAFTVPFLLKEENGIKVTLDGARQASTAYEVTSNDTQSTVTFNTAPTAAATVANKTTPAQKIAITTDTWYDVQPSQDAGQYLADDVPLVEENVFTVPIHQRSENFNMRIFSDSPFPVSLNSMMWEGQYSPRFYRRT